MQAISGAHALLTNIVLAWNTSRMHEEVEKMRRSGIHIEDDWLRRIGPAHFGHINFRGTMRFGVEKFAAALIQRAPAPGSSGGFVTRPAASCREPKHAGQLQLTTVVKQSKILS